MPTYDSQYTGLEIDQAVAKFLHIEDQGGVITSNEVDEKLEDYLSITSAASTYLSKTDAASTYLSKTDASNTYLTKTNAQSSYAPLTGTGTSGTWPISITGSAGSVNWNNVSNKPIIKSGYNTFAKSGSSSLGSATIYYATGRVNFSSAFNTVPTVVVCANDLAGGVFAAEIDGAVDKSGFTCSIYGADTSTYGVYWIAVGT